MTINLITFASHLNEHEPIRRSHDALISELEKHFTLNFIKSDEMSKLSKNDFKILFVATGGVEQLILKHFEELPYPTIMIADGIDNSLGAALEISSFLHDKGIKNEILHGKVSHIVERIKTLYHIFKARYIISKSKVGIIGPPSTWLISSSIDYLLAKQRWGLEFVEISLERVYKEFENITDNEVGALCAAVASQATECREGSPEDIIKAMRMYKAIKNICLEEGLEAITLSCFKLIKAIDTTGCIALSLLNDEGIVAGCEGDLQALFTLLAVKAITGKSAFMGNPSMIDVENNEMILSHCSIGLKQTKSYIIRNHFETKAGIAIQGILPIGDVTVLKCGGECLNDYFLSAGKLIKNTNFTTMCRTQAKLMLDEPVEYFLTKPLGNHHIMVEGNYANIFNEFFESTGCKRINYTRWRK